MKNEAAQEGEPTSDEWLTKANSAYETSTSFADTNWKKQWDNNIRMFQSRHINGSKYNTEAYKYRSKLFRPKTRSNIRATEAAGAAAFFSSMDVVSIQPVGDSDNQKIGAKLIKELVSYRLAQPDMHWFLTCIGGLQDAQKMGVVASYNYWKESGKKEGPCVELMPIEQVLFHPGASWIDPINSSPYVIRMIPMFIQDVKENEDYADCEDGDFQKALISLDTMAQARNKNQEDPRQAQVPNVDDYSMVWVHECIMRKEGQDYVFHTLHTSKRLSAPRPLEEVYLHGERPITLGYYILETHRSMQPGVPELGEQLQREGNEIVNSRQDNVKLALNKRYLVRRGANLNMRSLLRNAAGSATITDEPDRDVRELEWNDVTRSSYEEQNRIDVDFDSLMGGFDTASIKNNRGLNETVGGMQMMQSASGQITDYGLKTFSETWLEPTLRQVAKLEQHYESDETVVNIAAEKAKVWDEISDINEELMTQDMLLTVDVGVGSSNPGFRLERFISGISTFTRIVKEAPPGMNIQEVGAELFGYLGYKDGSRFFELDEESGAQIQELTQAVQQLQQELESKQQEQQVRVAIAQGKEDAAMERQKDSNVFELIKESLKQHGADNDVRMQGIETQVQSLANMMAKNYTNGN